MLYIITVETVSFIDGRETTSLEKTGVLSADSRWDALKTAKAVAKVVARDHWVLADDHSFFWETTREGKIIGAFIRREEVPIGDGLTYGVMVKIHPLSVEKDGIA